MEYGLSNDKRDGFVFGPFEAFDFCLHITFIELTSDVEVYHFSGEVRRNQLKLMQRRKRGGFCSRRCRGLGKDPQSECDAADTLRNSSSGYGDEILGGGSTFVINADGKGSDRNSISGKTGDGNVDANGRSRRACSPR